MFEYSLLALKRNLKKDFIGFETIKLAILGDSSTQFFTIAIKGLGYELKTKFDIFEADYNQIEQLIYDSNSKLYSSKREYIIIFNSTQKLIKSFYKLSNEKKSEFAETEKIKIKDIYNTLISHYPYKIIIFNFTEIDDKIFGNYANKTPISFLYQVRKLNCELMKLSQDLNNLYINDINSLQNIYGYNFVFDSRNYINADMVLSTGFVPKIAKNTVDIINALSGKFKKCLILDLDNTLWGGVIGDDGIENIEIGDLGIGKAFFEFQLWIKELKKRGIILAVCSKNNEQIAQEPFKKHPGMVLGLDDFVVFTANWNNKADNIRDIQNVLNIGFDSMVFIDDNPFERNLVSTHIPDITVPDMPEDPAEYVVYLRTLNLFETSSFVKSDELRTRQYKEDVKRSILKKSFTNIDIYLENLQMVSGVCSFDKFNMPRVVQLIQRSNQFNLRTVRYSEEEVIELSKSGDNVCLSFTLEDKYGYHGLISVVILKKIDSSFFIDTWIMSCRVLKRGMENFVLGKIVELAKKCSLDCIIGEYIPTAKNALVKDHYLNLGFNNVNKMWTLKIKNYKNNKSFIAEKSKDDI